MKQHSHEEDRNRHRDIRRRFEAAAQSDPDGRWREVDAGSLIGIAPGITPAPRLEVTDPSDPTDPTSAAETLAMNANDPELIEEYKEEAAERILSVIARNRPPDAGRMLASEIDAMLEPIRTVAFNHLFLGIEIEDVAQRMSLPVATADFLCDVALHQIERALGFSPGAATRAPD